MPNWVQKASDGFTGTDGTNLTASGNWTANNGIIIYKSLNNTARNNSAGVLNLYSYTGVSFLTNQYAQVTLFLDGGNPNCGVSCRVQSGSASGYVMAYDTANVTLYRYDSAVFHSLATAARSYANGNRLRLEVTGVGSGTRLNGYEDTGSGFTLVNSTFTNFDPSTYYDGGSPGLYGFSNNFNWELQTWSGGDDQSRAASASSFHYADSPMGF